MLVALAIGVGLLLAVRFSMAVEFSFNGKDPFSTILRSLLYWLPFYLGLAIPVSLFAGLMLGFDRMGKANELVILQACGLRPIIFLRPVMLITMIATMFGILIYGWVDPLTTYARRAFNHVIEHKAVFFALEDQTFIKFGNSVILLESIDRDQGSFSKVFIYRNTAGGKTETITAKSGKIIQQPGSKRPILALYDVNKLDIAPSPADTKKTKPFDTRRAHSSQLSTPIGPEIIPFRKRGSHQKEWTLPELIKANIAGVAPIRFQRVKTELHFRLAEIIFITILPFFAVAFSDFFNQRRAHYELGFGIVAMIVAYEMLVISELLAISYNISPVLVIWLPFLLIIAAVGVQSYQIFTRPTKIN